MPEGRRTTALRGPGAGGFTPASALVVSNPCLNCGTNIQLEYCPECGQKEINADPTLREFLMEIAEGFLHWDGKVVRTFRMLVTKPGKLTEEYIAGRRVRFIAPLRVFVACAVVYFLCAALAPAMLVEPTARAAGVTTRAIPIVVLLLLPVMAWLLGTAFRDRHRNYPQHLVFALHVHAVLFLLMTVLLLQRLTSNGTVHSIIQLIVAVPMTMYFMAAARRLYGGPQHGTVRRWLTVLAGYVVVFSAVLAAVYFIAQTALSS